MQTRIDRIEDRRIKENLLLGCICFRKTFDENGGAISYKVCNDSNYEHKSSNIHRCHHTSGHDKN
jgi:hypothetical protein